MSTIGVPDDDVVFLPRGLCLCMTGDGLRAANDSTELTSETNKPVSI